MRLTSALVERSNANGIATKRPPAATVSAAPGGRRRVVVAALDQHVGAAGDDQGARRVVVERHDEVDGAERGEHGHPVLEHVERALLALAEASHRGVGVDGDDQRGAEPARLLEIRDVAAMQDIEHAVGEHERTRQRGDARERIGGRRDLGRVAGGGNRDGVGHRGRGDARVARPRCKRSVRVLEDLDDPRDAGGRGGDLRGGVAFRRATRCPSGRRRRAR